jgi:thymidylate kinase
LARIIELCGAPGAGKSTIYAEIVEHWKKDDNWVPGHFLYPSQKIRRTNFKLFAKSLIDKIYKIPDAAAMKNAGEQFVAENPVYVDAVWNNIFYRNKEIVNSGNLRFHAADYWFKIFQKIQVLKNSDSKKLALVDEGLIQRIDSALYKSQTIEEEKEEIKHLLPTIPLPDGLIYVATDIKENVLRLRSRKKILKVHANLSDEDLMELIKKYQQRWNFVTQKLHEKNIPVLKINGQLSTKENASLILKFLKELK